jgi:hypothetical protein
MKVENTTPVVCLNTKEAVTICVHCKSNPAKRLYCSNACRQAAYRLSPAYAEAKTRAKDRRLSRRNRWVAAKTRDKYLTFDGRRGGHNNHTVPPLGEFERVKHLD